MLLKSQYAAWKNVAAWVNERKRLNPAGFIHPWPSPLVGAGGASSPPQKRGSSFLKTCWIPAFAGMTFIHAFSSFSAPPFFRFPWFNILFFKYYYSLFITHLYIYHLTTVHAVLIFSLPARSEQP
jgi:hypothetical protein